jgi:LysM repeat protein
MRWRVIAPVSLGINLVLAAGWLFVPRHRLANLATAAAASQGAGAGGHTNLVVRRQFFSWREVESSDYPTYIANLREIGCPEQTVRDIIIADVNTLYARKRSSEILTPEQQWWRTEPDSNIVRFALVKIRELDSERRELLTRLLGPNWESGDQISLPRPSRPGLQLDGPVLGVLPNDVKQLVQEINRRSQDRIQAYTEAQRDAGKPLIPAELARMREQTRVELSGVLSPQQLEEYLLRYSQSAGDLRSHLGQLKFFNATPEEFRTLFRATDPFDIQIQTLSGATDDYSLAQLKSVEDQRENAIRIALGPQRYEQYRRFHDPDYRDAYAAAVEAGTPEAAATLYQINQETADEQARIRSNTNLTPAQLAYELKKAELELIKASAAALGQELPPEPLPEIPPPPPKVHVLKAGEGLNFLAQLYGVSPNALRAANPNLNFTKLKPGQSVMIPIALMPLVPVPTMP